MQDFFHGIANNHVFKVTFSAWIIAQILKVITTVFVHGKLDLMRSVGAGGMPSAHSALVTALAVSIGQDLGWDSPIFAMALAFAAIVMYDAAGVRRAAGKQAEVINQIISDIYHGTQISEERLKELIGHTPFEVLMGALLGLLVGLFF
ncbi:MAG: divergent PAP2 family protein [Bacillota bacterium]|uniref:Divergent PAP2 family protein n=1 Tax=Thermanaerosceptrum fracticalcis TaxID=1712410 RepID=A0A7G6E0D8_THEFR|nr:divergent PAP2 family protein [Thermanaerosceptrum fracticalcis]QNB45542.1 divergent PAP2 family protein [Thermanaerosceptrum fracticalcis]